MNLPPLSLRAVPAAARPRISDELVAVIARSPSDAAIWGLGAGDYFVAGAPRNDSGGRFIRRSPGDAVIWCPNSEIAASLRLSHDGCSSLIRGWGVAVRARRIVFTTEDMENTSLRLTEHVTFVCFVEARVLCVGAKPQHPLRPMYFSASFDEACKDRSERSTDGLCSSWR